MNKSSSGLSAADRRQSILLSIVVSSLFSLIVFSAIVIHTFHEEFEDVEDSLSQVEGVLAEGRIKLQQLHRLGSDSCSTQHLLDMREILFGQSYIRDIIYRDFGKPLCSSVIGLLDEHATERTDYFALSNGLTVRKETDQSRYGYNFSGYSVGDNQYELVYSDGFAAAFVPQDHHYEIVLLSNNIIKHIAGIKHLYTGKVSSFLDWRPSSGLRSELCSDTSNLCLATQRSLINWLEDSVLDLIIALFACCLLGLLTYRLRNQAIEKHHSIKSRVLRGLAGHRFYALYQPIVKMDSQEVIGCEVLARFEDEYGAIYPDQFIPLIQELDQTWKFSAAMIDRALKELAQQPGLPEQFRVSFNLYPSDVSSGAIGAIEQLVSVQENRFPLTFEIIEDQFLDEDLARKHLAKLHAQGHTIAIDDFGKGYSNLQQIQKIHCQILKIDRSFVIELEEGSIRASLIPNIIEIARKAELRLVAEGVENAKQHQLLRDWGIEFGQGWLFGKPMSAEALALIVERLP